MRFSSFLIGILIVFLVFSAFGTLFVNLKGSDQYNVNVSETFQGAYTNAENLSHFVEQTSGIGAEMTNASKTAKQVEGEYDDPTKSQFRALKLAWNGYGIVKDLIINTASLMKIPPILVGVILGALVFLLLFGFISLIFRFKS